MPFSLRSERTLAPTHACERYVVVDLSPPPAPGHEARAPAHLSLVIDRSGSMGGGKLTLALQGARQVLASLDERDRFSVVVFDDGVDVVVPSTVATPDARRAAADRLARIDTGGSTDLGAGWLTGAGEVGKALGADAVGRCVLLTDGEANRGIVDAAELGAHARALRRRRVTTTTIGLGEGFNEFLLGRMAEEGGGHFHFAGDETRLADIFRRELGDLFAESARDVTVVLDAPPGARVESLNGYVADGRGAFAVGALRGGRRVEAVFRVTLPPSAAHEVAVVGVRVRERDGVFGDVRQELTWRRDTPSACAAESPASDVAVLVAELEDALARSTALARNHEGDFAAADAVVDAASARLRQLGCDDAAVVALRDKLADDRRRLTRPMPSRSRKEDYIRSYSSQKRRMLEDLAAQDEAARRARAAAAAMAKGLHPRAGSRSLLLVVDEACRALAGVAAAAPLLHGGPRGIEAWPTPLSPDREQRLRRDLRVGEPAATVLFVAQELDDAWFSHWHPQERVAVVSTAGFAELTGLPLVAFVAYELLLQSLRTRSERFDAREFLHREGRGCFFDFCGDKGEIAVQLQAGHVCDDCVAGLVRVGIDPQELAAQWSVVQSLAHPAR
ncbi:MAG: VWA domain-containing protein [Deltaproteobacteria bacterium]|nr:VWA domain-containing protein [Deltaproteobacteria bacterium]